MPNYYAGLPGFVKIGPHETRISVVAKVDKERSRGSYSGLGGGIKLKRDMETPLEAMEVLIHEIMHAIWDVAKVDSGHEEDVVEIVSTWYASVLVDNPHLIRWIIKAITAR